jgi:acetamidase/formamidase
MNPVSIQHVLAIRLALSIEAVRRKAESSARKENELPHTLLCQREALGVNLLMKELTLAAQGEYCYTISPNNKPRLTVDPGEEVVVETEDAFSGQIRKNGDRRNLQSVPYPNPQSGPIYVNGAGKGDTLAVKIEDIQPLIGQGATRIVSSWYPTKYDSALTNKFLGHEDVPHGTRICPIKDGKVHFGEFEIPYRPMIGTLSTAYPDETYLSWLPGPHGGNMDLPQMSVGATVYLPVRIDGALLHIGDIHAVQGDGELSGAAVEMPARTRLKIDLLRNKPIEWPRLEDDSALYAIAATQAGRGLEDAMRLAFMNLILWLETDYDIDRWLAFGLLTLVSQVRIGNFWTVAVGMPKRYLRP